jgi:hypothetical protein
MACENEINGFNRRLDAAKPVQWTEGILALLLHVSLEPSREKNQALRDIAGEQMRLIVCPV